MIFNSVTFLVFLALNIIAYWSLPQRGRQWLIAVSSLGFYAFWRPEFTLVLLATAMTDYTVARKIDSSDSEASRRNWLVVSIVINLGLLFFFKYLFFFVENGVAVLQLFGWTVKQPMLNIVLPLGISFYTFESISYSVDVYRRQTPVERDLVTYIGFIAFFPKLIAGPILRAHQLLPQLKSPSSLEVDDVTSGVRRIIIGLCLKVVLADNFATLVDDAFQLQPSRLSALDVWTLAFLFGFQIYFDFSAYSHIAIGSARLMGIRLVENFDFPYTATSPREFWQRWHVSLSSWIRDYVYLPLMGVRPRRIAHPENGGLAITADVASPSTVTMTRRSCALIATWALMGLWHGANWTFVLWGAMHAAFIFVQRSISPWAARLPAGIRLVGGLGITLPMMMIAWIPFRSENMEQALALLGHVVRVHDYTWLGLRENTYVVTAVLLVGVLMARPLYSRVFVALDRSAATAFAANLIGFAILGGLVFVFLRPISQFIYFAF